ncbi:uncharacterized protein LOC144448948 [Glandiceps talaboti]
MGEPKKRGKGEECIDESSGRPSHRRGNMKPSRNGGTSKDEKGWKDLSIGVIIIVVPIVVAISMYLLATLGISDCKPLAVPASGSLSSADVKSGSTVFVNCNNGFTAVGGVLSTTCYAGIWDSSLSDCVADCTPLTSPISGSLSSTDVTSDSNITLTCNNGFTAVDGVTSTTCNAGTWSATLSDCVADCTPLTSPISGSLSSTDVTSGSTITLTCNNGFTAVDGVTSTTCNAGKWSATLSGCVADCTPLSPISGSLSSTDVTSGSTITLTCNNGFTAVDGVTSTTCNAGKWSTTLSDCIAVVTSEDTPVRNTSEGSRSHHSKKTGYGVETTSSDTVQRKSILIINDEWGTSKGGISALHREIAIQAKDAGYNVFVTALGATEEDMKDATQNGITILIADILENVPPNLDALNLYHSILHFPCLELESSFDVIIGHVPITSVGALSIQKNRFPSAEVFLFIHVIPQDTDFHRSSYNIGTIEDKVDRITDRASVANSVFSVGPKIFRNFQMEFHGMDVNHKQYIPRPSQVFFEMDVLPFKENDPYHILTVGRISNVENLKGYDIAAAALGEVAYTFHDTYQSNVVWRIRGIPPEKQADSLAFIRKHRTSKYLQVWPMEYGSQKKIANDMRKTRLFLMPSRSEPFGMVGLEAIAAGVPVLVTANSGLAEFLNSHFDKHTASSMIVNDVGLNDVKLDEDIGIWSKRIRDVLLYKYSDTFKTAQFVKKRLKEMSEEDTSFREALAQVSNKKKKKKKKKKGQRPSCEN